MTWEQTFIERLASVDFSDVFNPYRDRCEVHDLENATSIRRLNLECVLKTRLAMKVDSIWFGRDLGYRGGRRTGLALTDEVMMFSADAKSGNTPKLARATRGLPVAERTAAVIWSVINRLGRPPMLWNAFPFHPHEPGAPFTNRAHTARERRLSAWTLETLIGRFGNPRLIAIGNDASKALSDLGFEHEVVRHPSYGGQREFIDTMEMLHGLEAGSAEISASTLL